MKLQHYIGGLESLGPVAFERRVFVEPWETRIFGIHVAMMALSTQLPLPATPSPFHTVWTWADLRTGAESLSPFDYFKHRYYEKWLGGISGYFIANGYITEAELDARTKQILVNPAAGRKTGGDPAIDKRVVTYLVEGDSAKKGPQEAAGVQGRRQGQRQESADRRAHPLPGPSAQPCRRGLHRLSGLLHLSNLHRSGRNRSGDAGLLRHVQSRGDLAGQYRKGPGPVCRHLRGLS
jgi:hypothetical protein